MDTGTVNLVVPLGILLCRFSMAIISPLVLVFIAQLYFIPLGPTALLFIVFGAVVASVTTEGMPALVSLAMLGVVAAPLGLPFGATMLILVPTLPIIDPMLTVANVHGNGAAVVVIAKQVDAADHALQSDDAPSGARPMEAVTPA